MPPPCLPISWGSGGVTPQRGPGAEPLAFLRSITLSHAPAPCPAGCGAASGCGCPWCVACIEYCNDIGREPSGGECGLTQETALCSPALPVFEVEYVAAGCVELACRQFRPAWLLAFLRRTNLVRMWWSLRWCMATRLPARWALEALLERPPALLRGTLTVGFVNLDAYERFDPKQPTASRYVDEDMNRLWDVAVLDGPRVSNELSRARAIRPVIEAADVPARSAFHAVAFGGFDSVRPHLEGGVIWQWRSAPPGWWWPTMGIMSGPPADRLRAFHGSAGRGGGGAGGGRPALEDRDHRVDGGQYCRRSGRDRLGHAPSSLSPPPGSAAAFRRSHGCGDGGVRRVLLRAQFQWWRCGAAARHPDCDGWSDGDTHAARQLPAGDAQPAPPVAGTLPFAWRGSPEPCRGAGRRCRNG